MCTYNYNLGGYVFRITSVHKYFSLYAKEYITNDKHQYEIEDTLEELEEFSKAYAGEDVKNIETLLIQKKVVDILLTNNVVNFHGSSLYLDNADNGYIFTAPSGTGKSTHVARLKEHYKDRLTIINDDKPFISKIGKSYYIYGSPWSGKSHISSNVKAKLKAILIIYQSKSNEISKMDNKEAIKHLIREIHIPKGVEATSLGLDFLINMIKDIDIYYLGLNLDKDAINNTIKVMEGNL